jgi:hypothetical protein
MHWELYEHFMVLVFVSVSSQTKEQFLWVLYAETETVRHPWLEALGR